MKKLRVRIFITDILALYISLVLAVLVRGLIHIHATQNSAVWLSAHLNIFLPSFLFSILALYIAGMYELKIIYDRTKTITLLLYAQVSTAIFSIISFYVLKTNLTPKLTIFLYVIFSITILSFTRSYIFNSLQKREKFKAAYVGKNEQDTEIFDVHFAPFDLIHVSDIASAKNFQYIIYDENILNQEMLLELETLKNAGKNILSYHQYYEFLFRKVDLKKFDYHEFMKQIGDKHEGGLHFLFRKMIDLLCGIILLPFFIVSLPFVLIGNYFFSKGSLFSVQERVGYLGKMVKIYKLRTMKTTDIGGLYTVENGVQVHKLKNEITRIGKFLRKTRIDELPQCINFLKGDISAIGPRADIIGVHNDMKANIENYTLRLLLPQGLSGWAQVHMNFPPRTHEEHIERLSYELYYIKYHSISLDISIILKTIKTVLSREGS